MVLVVHYDALHKMKQSTVAPDAHFPSLFDALHLPSRSVIGLILCSLNPALVVHVSYAICRIFAEKDLEYCYVKIWSFLSLKNVFNFLMTHPALWGNSNFSSSENILLIFEK